MASPDTASIETTARTVDGAVALALDALACARTDVRVTVIDAGSVGRILGFGARPARVRVARLGDGDEGDHDEVAEAVGLESTTTHLHEAEGEATTVAEAARRILSELLHLMGFDEAHLEVVELEPLTLNVRGPDASDLIGRRGETLRAIQFIVGIMVNKAIGQHVRITIDIDGYRQRREVLLRDLAIRLAGRVVATGTAVHLEAMPPNERRIVHMSLAEHPDVATESTGEGDTRRVVIMLRS